MLNKVILIGRMATDPELNAWYDRRGYENADKCAWTFGSTSTAPNGSLYNMSMGGRNWLIQQNWVNAVGVISMSADASCSGLPADKVQLPER